MTPTAESAPREELLRPGSRDDHCSCWSDPPLYLLLFRVLIPVVFLGGGAVGSEVFVVGVGGMFLFLYPLPIIMCAHVPSSAFLQRFPLSGCSIHRSLAFWASESSPHCQTGYSVIPSGEPICCCVSFMKLWNMLQFPCLKVRIAGSNTDCRGQRAQKPCRTSDLSSGLSYCATQQQGS